MSILKNYLKKIGVKEFSELTEEEKETYRGWEESLAGRKITDDDVAVFLKQEEDETIEKLIGSKLSERQDTFLKMKLEFTKKLIVFLNVPAMEKEMTEKSINQLIK